MKKFVIRISIILLIVAALPLGYFVMKQASRLSENEAIVQRVFDAQLETILYTVNQNSENYINTWVNQLDLPVVIGDGIFENVVSEIFENNISIKRISFFDLNQREKTRHYFQRDFARQTIIEPDSLLQKKLINDWQSKYQRIESVRDGEYTKFYFILKAQESPVIAELVIHTSTFVAQNLGPGVQAIEQGRFAISVYDGTFEKQRAVNDTINIIENGVHRQRMWYLPGYEVSIKLGSATISELVTDRSKMDLYIFSGLAIVMVLGILFVIFAIRKEVRLAEMKSEFVSNVSHEIRTPLALISMYAETLLLKRVKTEEKATEYLKIIHLETDRLTNMVNRILNFSKMEKDKRLYQFSDVVINDVVEEVVRNFEPHFKNQKVTCNLELAESDPLIYADKEAIIEALINVIENAIKYGKPEDKKVLIRTSITEKYCEIEIEDNGIGISAKHIHHIFDKFYRVTQGNLAHKAKGTGIGLNIVKQILEKHDGKVEVRSQEREGSCFTLKFPCK